MNESEKILSELAYLKELVSRRLDQVEERLDTVEKISKATVSRSRRHEASIEELQKKVAELAENAAVWRSRDRSEVGIDHERAYEAFRGLKYTPRDALHLLEAAGILRRSGQHMTRPVRTGDRVVRAIVIMEE